jgi:hypothetical protein
MHLIKNLFIFFLLFYAVTGLAKKNDYQELLVKLHVPDGFTITIFDDNIPEARSLALGDNGIVYVGTSENRVYAIEDSNNDGDEGPNSQRPTG